MSPDVLLAMSPVAHMFVVVVPTGTIVLRSEGEIQPLVAVAGDHRRRGCAK
jgi:hypothetical protein